MWRVTYGRGGRARGRGRTHCRSATCGLATSSCEKFQGQIFEWVFSLGSSGAWAHPTESHPQPGLPEGSSADIHLHCGLCQGNQQSPAWGEDLQQQTWTDFPFNKSTQGLLWYSEQQETSWQGFHTYKHTHTWTQKGKPKTDWYFSKAQTNFFMLAACWRDIFLPILITDRNHAMNYQKYPELSKMFSVPSASPLGKKESIILSSTSLRTFISALMCPSSLAMMPEHLNDLEKELVRVTRPDVTPINSSYLFPLLKIGLLLWLTASLS